MRQQILELVEKPVLKTEVPKFAIGDTVDVHTKILEGDKARGKKQRHTAKRIF